MNIEELEHSLAETRNALAETQRGVLKLAEMNNRLIEVLIRVKGGLTDLDKSYIIGKITKEEYIKKYAEQCNPNNLGELFMHMFDTFPTTKEDKTSEAD